MDTDKKKQLKSEYKGKAVIGAVYKIECSKDGSKIIKSTNNIEGIKNRYQFAIMTKSCPDPALRNVWTKYGSDSFSLVVLEEIKMKEDQTPKEFAEDIKLLHELWLEKLKTNDL